MTSITTSAAQSFSSASVPGQFLREGDPTDQFWELLPFHAIDGYELKLSTIDASVDGLAANAGAVAAGGSLNATFPTIVERSVPLARVAAQLDVDNIIPGIYGSRDDILDALIELKRQAVRDQIRKLCIVGDTANAGEFDGLQQLVGTTIGAAGNAADGGTVLPGEMEQLVAAINPRFLYADVYFVMHASAFMHLLKHSYSYVEYTGHPALGSLPAIAGTPILVCNMIPTDETKGTGTNLTSIYAVVLGRDVGLCGIYPVADEEDPIRVEGPTPADGTDSSHATVSMDVALAQYNLQSAARMDGVDWGQ